MSKLAIKKNQEIEISKIKIKKLTVPFEYRADCKLGLFKQKEELLNNTLAITLIAHKIEAQSVKFGQEEPKNWVCLKFLDQKNVLSELWLHSYSFQNFVEFIEKITIIDEEPELGLNLRLSFAKITAKKSGNTFFVVKTELVDKEEPRCSDELLRALFENFENLKISAPNELSEFADGLIDVSEIPY
jgi:hypothetical protein